MSAGDNSTNGALRELQEEIGIKISKEELNYLFTFREHKELKEDYIDNEISDVYLVKKDIDLKDLKMQKEEVAELKFIHYKDLKKRILAKDNTIVEHTEMYNKLFDFLENGF